MSPTSPSAGGCVYGPPIRNLRILRSLSFAWPGLPHFATGRQHPAGPAGSALYKRGPVYVMGNGCKWRGLPEEFGKWGTFYHRIRRWADKGVLERVLTSLHDTGIIKIDMKVMSMDRHDHQSSFRRHWSVEGQRTSKHRKITRRVDHETAHDRQRRQHSSRICHLTRPSTRRPSRTRTDPQPANPALTSTAGAQPSPRQHRRSPNSPRQHRRSPNSPRQHRRSLHWSIPGGDVC